MWFYEEGCKHIIANALRNNGDLEPCVKLKQCSEDLKIWSRKTFGELKRRISGTEKALKKAQTPPI